MWEIGDKCSVWGKNSALVEDCEIYNIFLERGIVQIKHLPTGEIGLFEIDDLICPHLKQGKFGWDCPLIDPEIITCEDCPND